MTENERNTILNAIKNKDYSIIRNVFPYEKRKQLIVFLDELDEIYSDEELEKLVSSFFTSDEAIKFFNETSDVNIRKNLMYCIDDDDFKIGLISSYKNLTFSILRTLSSDEKLLEAIDKIDKDFREPCYYSFIKYFHNDENRIKYVEKNNITDVNKLEELIKALNDVNLKYEVFNKYIHKLYPKYEKYILFQLINSISDQKLKLEYMNQYIDDFIKNKFKLCSMKHTISGYRETEFNILEIVRTFSTQLSDEYKIKVLEIYKKLENSITVDFKFVNDILNEVTDFSNISRVYDYVISKYIINYKDIINSNHLILFVEKFGLEALKYLDNKNIIKIINLSDTDFIKFINLFSDNFLNLDNQLVNTVYNSCIQREYRINNSLEYNMFSLIKDAIDARDLQKLKELLIKINISNVIDGDIDTIIDKILNSNDINFYLDKINDLTNAFIAKRREMYIEERKKDFYSEVKLDSRYGKNAAIKYFLEHLNCDDILNVVEMIMKININNLDNDVRYLVNDKERLISILRFKIDPKNEKYNGDKVDIKRFSKILNYTYEYHMIKLPDNLDLNVEYYPRKVKKSTFLPMLLDINVDNLVNNIFNDNEMYKTFLDYLSRYKMLGYGNTFDSVFKKCDIEYGNDTVIGFISYFNKIIEKINGNRKNELMLLIDWSNCYSSISSIYGIILGIEDYGLLKSNPGPNSASLGRQERLDIALNKIKLMYERNYITVPTINEDIKLKSGNSINVTLGNITDTINLTCGERTGACMRIGGAGATLLDYCIEKENGFHIIFRNPTNGNFVTRVTGFRNGNTIFLNQLRFSKDNSYGTEDIIEACKRVAKMLIVRSKDSSYPLDNVVISATEAMTGTFKEEKLNIYNPTDNLGYFYSDIKDSGIVLATISEDSLFVPINFNQENIPKYDTVRQKVKIEQDRLNMYNVVNKIRIINDLINGKEIDNIDIVQEECLSSVSYVISGEDFYITLDKFGNIIEEFIIDKRKNNDRTLKEINRVKEIYLKKEAVDTYENGYNI